MWYGARQLPKEVDMEFKYSNKDIEAQLAYMQDDPTAMVQPPHVLTISLLLDIRRLLEKLVAGTAMKGH